MERKRDEKHRNPREKDQKKDHSESSECKKRHERKDRSESSEHKKRHEKKEQREKPCKDCVVNDKVAKRVEKLWKDAFQSALLLPVIGYPSNADGVATLTHQLNDSHPMKLNGLVSKSPLANSALYSFECSDGKYINLYEIMLPDIPGKHGEISTAQYYVKLLGKYGLDVAGFHFHWTGAFMQPEATLIAAIHHQTTDHTTPEEFSRKTILAIEKTVSLIKLRTQHHK